MPSKLILLRHAQSVKNLKKIHGGQGEELTDLGINQAKEAAHIIAKICDNDFDIYASTSFHTRKTAEVIANELGIDVKKPFDFRPLYLGVADGLSEQELLDKYPEVSECFAKWRKREIDIKGLIVPEMESYQSFWDRGKKLLSSFPKDRNCVLVCSNSLMILLTHVALNHNPETSNKYRHISIQNCGMVVFDVGREYSFDSNNTNVDIEK